MIIKQLSIFLENKKGMLCAAIDVLAGNGVNISALSLADTADFGILRLIVDKPDEAQTLLRDSGVFVRVTDVIAVAMDDAPGGAVGILKALSAANLNIEYMYAFVGRESGKALTVLRADDTARAEQVLQENGFGQVNPTDIYRI